MYHYEILLFILICAMYGVMLIISLALVGEEREVMISEIMVDGVE